MTLYHINDTDKVSKKSNIRQLVDILQVDIASKYDDNGTPDKKSNLDHLPDAGTYPIAFEIPVVKPVADLRVRFAR